MTGMAGNNDRNDRNKMRGMIQIKCIFWRDGVPSSVRCGKNVLSGSIFGHNSFAVRGCQRPAAVVSKYCMETESFELLGFYDSGFYG